MVLLAGMCGTLDFFVHRTEADPDMFNRGLRVLSLSILNDTGTLYKCRLLWIGQAVFSQMALMSMEIILMLRGKILDISWFCYPFGSQAQSTVYALYNRTRRIGLLLLSVLIVKNLIQAFCSSTSIPALPFHDFCLIKPMPKSVLYSGYALYHWCLNDCWTETLCLALRRWSLRFLSWGWRWSSTYSRVAKAGEGLQWYLWCSEMDLAYF